MNRLESNTSYGGHTALTDVDIGPASGMNKLQDLVGQQSATATNAPTGPMQAASNPSMAAPGVGLKTDGIGPNMSPVLNSGGLNSLGGLPTPGISTWGMSGLGPGSSVGVTLTQAPSQPRGITPFMRFSSTPQEKNGQPLGQVQVLQPIQLQALLASNPQLLSQPISITPLQQFGNRGINPLLATSNMMNTAFSGSLSSAKPKSSAAVPAEAGGAGTDVVGNKRRAGAAANGQTGSKLEAGQARTWRSKYSDMAKLEQEVKVKEALIAQLQEQVRPFRKAI